MGGKYAIIHKWQFQNHSVNRALVINKQVTEFYVLKESSEITEVHELSAPNQEFPKRTTQWAG